MSIWKRLRAVWDLPEEFPPELPEPEPQAAAAPMPAYTGLAHDRRYSFLLLDGTVREVNSTQFHALESLRIAMDFVALGVTRSLSVVEINGEATVRETLVTIDGSHLDILAERLAKQSKAASELATIWEGNCPVQSRSLSKH